MRSRVANIASVLPEHRRAEISDAVKFMKYIAGYVSNIYGVRVERFDESFNAGIEKLAAEKYSTDEWNLRGMGSFDTERQRRFGYGSVELRMSVTEGRITRARIRRATSSAYATSASSRRAVRCRIFAGHNRRRARCGRRRRIHRWRVARGHHGADIRIIRYNQFEVMSGGRSYKALSDYDYHRLVGLLGVFERFGSAALYTLIPDSDEYI